MFSRWSPPLVASGVSVLVLAGLIGALVWIGDNRPAITIYCAEAMRPAMEEVSKDYDKEFGQKVEVSYDASQTCFVKLAVAKRGDLFLPADDSYIQLAKDKELIDKQDVFNVARMHAVVIVRPNFPTAIKTWPELLALGNRLAIGNTDTTAIGSVLKANLQAEGRWSELAKQKRNEMVNVNQVLNSVKLGSSDAGIVWDAVAKPHPELTIVEFKELASVQARVQIAITKFSTQRDAARQFIRFLRTADKGGRHFKAQGFADIEEERP